ncbi:S-adenosylmethionine decarboxylase [Pararobbsia alpina]
MTWRDSNTTASPRGSDRASDTVDEAAGGKQEETSMKHFVDPIQACGLHVIADLDEIDAEVLRDASWLESVLLDAARAAGAHVLSSHFHHFGGEHGVTGVVMLAESHISLHTWPERRFAALDVFMCGRADAREAAAYVSRKLGVAEPRWRVCERGAKPR